MLYSRCESPFSLLLQDFRLCPIQTNKQTIAARTSAYASDPARLYNRFAGAPHGRMVGTCPPRDGGNGAHKKVTSGTMSRSFHRGRVFTIGTRHSFCNIISCTIGVKRCYLADMRWTVDLVLLIDILQSKLVHENRIGKQVKGL